MGLRLHVLYLGKMEFPKFRLVDWKDENEMVVSPAVSLLIQHPTLGNILYDTLLRCTARRCCTTTL